MKIRVIVALVIVGFSVLNYLFNSQTNPVTGENQRVAISEKQEIALGLQSLPKMLDLHNGRSDDPQATRKVQEMGARLMNALYHRLNSEGIEVPYPFDFHLLNDDRVVNAFALPGGQVFVTEALFYQMTHEGQLAGVLGHEIGHVLERHSAQRMAKGQMFQGMAGAAAVAGGDANSGRMMQMVTNLINMKYGRNAELESDRWGVELMVLSGYDPNHMLEVMNILENSSGGGGRPEFLSTHPKPKNRKEYIRKIIAEKFPRGVPPGLR